MYTDKEIENALLCTVPHGVIFRRQKYDKDEFSRVLVEHGKIIYFQEFMEMNYMNPYKGALHYINVMYKLKKWHMMHFYAEHYIEDASDIHIPIEINNYMITYMSMRYPENVPTNTMAKILWSLEQQVVEIYKFVHSQDVCNLVRDYLVYQD